MRLIDADALKAFINERIEQDEPYYCERDLNGFDMICMLCDAQTVMEWHCAKTDPPKRQGRYLTYSERMHCVRETIYTQQCGWHEVDGGQIYDMPVDYWMELPDPPEESKQ